MSVEFPVTGVTDKHMNSGGESETTVEKQVNLHVLRRNLWLISIISLFCELLVVRWLSTEIRIFAYFKNMPLMSAFLGLGLGFLWVDHKQDFFKWSGILLLYLSGILMFALALGWTRISFLLPTSQVEFMGNSSAIDPLGVVILLSIFAVCVILFAGFGQQTAKLFAQLKALEAYSINVFGGLVGILLFTLLCFLGADPGVWLAIVGLLLLAFERRAVFVAILLLGLAYTGLIGPYIAKKAYSPGYVATHWSPYYRIDVREKFLDGEFVGKRIGNDIYVNYDGFQFMADASPKNLAMLPKEMQNQIVQFHAKPFIAFGQKPENVLVLGSGNGSDVAAALRWGAKHVDAVEIDPGILNIGQEMHSEKPYASDRVSVYLTDARTFLKQTQRKYDVIVFAFLDSHSGFSSLSSLRMDNYIFTEESLREANKLLSARGVITLCFVVTPDWLWDRQCKTLAKATGQQPFGYIQSKPVQLGILFAGPGINGKTPEDMKSHWESSMPGLEWTVRDTKTSDKMPVPSDDWPFLFLPEKAIPASYLIPMLVILALSALPLLGELRQGRHSVLNGIMLLLGMGFMLQEVRSMANLSLLFGSTWIINSVVISAVMIFILAANWLAMRTTDKQLPLFFVLLLVSLAVSTLLDANGISQLGQLWGTLAGCLAFLLPLVFASVVFSLLFKHARNSTSALAFNLFGGVVGIALEYISMWLGIRVLGFIALALYSLIFVLYLCSRKKITQLPEIPSATE